MKRSTLLKVFLFAGLTSITWAFILYPFLGYPKELAKLHLFVGAILMLCYAAGAKPKNKQKVIYTRRKLEEYLEWLITPHTDEESERFRELNLVDDYLTIHNAIPNMTDQELIAAINYQLRPYGFKIEDEVNIAL